MELKEIVNQQKKLFFSEKTKDLAFRKAMLIRLYKGLEEREEEFLHALNKDLSKSRTEAYMTELSIVYSEIKTALKHLDSWAKPIKAGKNAASFPATNYIYTEPYGVVLVLSPWNYPLNLCLAPLVGAIAAGNCAVIKPSKSSLYTSTLIQKMINEIYPAKYIYCVSPKAEYDEVTTLRYDYIFFTGSPNVGKKIMALAANHLTPVSLELGGKSPCIVEVDANLKVAAKRIVWGKFLNAGQTCISVDYILVDNTVKEELIELLKDEILFRFPMAHKREDFPKIINEHHFDRLCGLIDRAWDVWGGQRDKETRKIAPAIIPNVSFSDEIMEEEIFGPILPVIGFDSLPEVVHQIKEREKPLACYIFTEDSKSADKLLSEISFGGGCVNDVLLHVANHHLPFGGVGNSGMGSYHGKYSFDTFSHKKSVVRNSTTVDIPLRYGPFDDKKLELLKKFL